MSFFLHLVGATVTPLCQNPGFDTAKDKESSQQINEK
jgi:hypothetical protein